MWYLLFFIVVGVASLVMVKVINLQNFQGDGEVIFGLASIVCFVVSLVFIISIPVNRMQAMSQLNHRAAIIATYNYFQADPESRVFAGKAVIEWNEWLLDAQYWNHTQWRMWYPDAVNSAQLISP